MGGYKRRTATIVFTVFVMLFALAPAGSPARAQEVHFAPGKYAGTFIFTFKHSYDRPSPEQGLKYNSYELASEKSKGSLGFRVDEKGGIYGVWVRFPRIEYSMVAEELVTFDSPCKGYAAFGKGFARINTTSVGPLQRVVSDTIFTAPIAIKGGVPYVDLQTIGSGCEELYTKGLLRDSIQWDLGAMIASPWAFHADSIADHLVQGTCATEAWLVPDHSLECTWWAYRKK